MPVTVQCPQCSKSLNVPDAMLGQRGRCPACNHVFVLSDGSIQAVPTSPVPPAQPAGNFGYPLDNYGADRRNEFENFHSGRQAVYTPPSTFNKLFYWYIGVESAGFLALFGLLMVYFVLASMKEPPPPNRTFQGAGGELDSDPFLRSSGAASNNSDDRDAIITLTFLGLGFLLLIAWVVLYYVLIYKAWALIQDGRTRTTPGQAVGLCFVPLFNLYWWFVAIRGLTEDMNGYARRRNMHIREASVGLATAYVVLRVLTCVPCLNYIALIPMLLVDMINVNSIRNAAADIAAAKAGS